MANTIGNESMEKAWMRDGATSINIVVDLYFAWKIHSEEAFDYIRFTFVESTKWNKYIWRKSNKINGKKNICRIQLTVWNFVVSNLIAYLANQALQLMLSIRNFYWPLYLPQFKV